MIIVDGYIEWYTSNFVISTAPVDGLAPVGAGASVAKVGLACTLNVNWFQFVNCKMCMGDLLFVHRCYNIGILMWIKILIFVVVLYLAVNGIHNKHDETGVELTNRV